MVERRLPKPKGAGSSPVVRFRSGAVRWGKPLQIAQNGPKVIRGALGRFRPVNDPSAKSFVTFSSHRGGRPMTLVVRGRNRRRGSAISARHGCFYPVLVYKRTPIVHQGIKRVGERKRVQPPLTERHQAVLALLDATPRGPTELGRRAGVTTSQVTSALHVLQARDLAQWAPGRGWWRT
jgi:DprA winged helix domain